MSEQDGHDGTLENIRVLIVGEDEASAGVRIVPGADVVGNTQTDGVVAAIDALKPNVLVLSPDLVNLASRMASSPAAVIVVPNAASPHSRAAAAGTRMLEIALRLAML